MRTSVGRAIRRRFGTKGTSGRGGLAEAARDDRHSAYWLGKVTGYVVWIGILTGKVFRAG